MVFIFSLAPRCRLTNKKNEEGQKPGGKFCATLLITALSTEVLVQSNAQAATTDPGTNTTQLTRSRPPTNAWLSALTLRTNFVTHSRFTDSRTNIASKPLDPSLSGPMTLSQAGPDSEVWTSSNTSTQRVSLTNAPAAKPRQIVHLATGLNYWDGTQWSRSQAFFHPSTEGDAFVADQVQHATRLEAQLNTASAVSIVLPDGGTNVLHSTPVAIGIYDPASGTSAILASVTNSTATLITSNKVLYANAFQENGVCASVTYTIKNGSFAQDVTIT